MRADHLTELTSAAPDFFADPYPAYQALRAEGHVRRIRMPGGEAVWLVLGYDAVRAALGDARLRNDIRHSSEFDSDGGYAIGRNMLQVDPPDHTRLRALVSRQFTARRIAGLEPRVRHISAELLDAMAPAGGGDLVDAYAFPLPITVICELLGVPAADRDAFHRWSSAIVAVTDAEAAMAGATAMTEYLTGLIEEKRHLAPGEDADLLHALVRTHDSGGGDDGDGGDGRDGGDGGDGGDHLAPDELLGMAFLLLVAGHETTVNLISSAIHLLLRHPDQLAALRADPGLLEGTIEETLRYEPSGQIAAYRYTAEPVTLAGTRIPQGERVVLSLAAANRDPARFADPERFDIRRDPVANRAQLAFSHGIHHCLGAPLARLEASVALPALLERFPDLALADASAAPEWRPSLLRGLRTLPVRW
ncbi:putative cytochrome P450 hydroxylase [Streptomyces sp. L-9-10]|uniref:cytochrome P450 family protein n=1 Tax=Streptomyces sp. L-9-10 TaxID=1478131 RepID=UPI00101CCAB5|nr:cytochrome P450 [Streptomyces sp. L-9-10]RYJ30609.1 putative cytochrome P450 hydroxylase [Streptomyces sp. L-9-10]